MRSPRSFMARRSWVVTDLVSSAIGSRARRGRGVELRQLALPEGPVRKLGVWDHERGLAHRSIAEADDIQVQRPRSPANARAPLAAALRFDGVEVNEQLGGLEGGFEQDHLVQVCPLWHRSEGGRLLDAGLPQQVGARQGRQPRARVREMRDRKSTRLNSSHGYISYAVFCLKKKTLKRRTVRLCPGVTRQRRIAAQR